MSRRASPRTGRRVVVAIDGPAGAGKSTAALRVAQRLGYVLVDTGALYRGVALAAKERGVAWSDGEAVGDVARQVSLRFENDPEGAPRLMLDGRDRSKDIRAPNISQSASEVSRHAAVREALLSLQRELGAEGGVVLEGRDIGTVVFPDAEVKVFLTASVGVRAERRHRELEGRGVASDLGEVRSEIEVRDARDSGREVAPLKPAPDALVLDTTPFDLDQVVDRLVQIVQEKTAGVD